MNNTVFWQNFNTKFLNDCINKYSLNFHCILSPLKNSPSLLCLFSSKTYDEIDRINAIIDIEIHPTKSTIANKREATLNGFVILNM